MRNILIAGAAAFLAGCGAKFTTLPLMAAVETTPVPSFDDAADDPAIWVNLENGELSRVIGTDKQAGLAVYDLSGRERQFLAIGPLNNVDLRQGVEDDHPDVAVASNDGLHAISVFDIDRDTGAVKLAGHIPTDKTDPYGICLGEGIETPFRAAVTYRDGYTQIWALRRVRGRLRGEQIGSIQFETGLEGCVFDEFYNALFVGEEERGVWRVDLTGPDLVPVLVDEIEKKNGLAMDVEGLTIWKGEEGQGFLVASAQGADRFVVYDRAPPHEPRGVFSIAGGQGIDAVTHTDGIDVVSAPVGDAYPNGLLVVQDDLNTAPDAPQNFKFVDWRNVEDALLLLPPPEDAPES
ncbi:MAG: phytase [Pseudomonadota bacterium]